MSEFPDDLHVETDNDSELVRTLRAALRKKDDEIKGLRTEVEKVRTATVESAIKDVLKNVPEGRREKVEKLIRKDAKSADDVTAWVEEYGDVFGVTETPGAESAGAGDGEEPQSGGLSEEEATAFERLQSAEAGGKPTAPVGPDQIRRVLDEAKGMSPAEGIEHLRKHGLAA